jgi:hypothetical protein
VWIKRGDFVLVSPIPEGDKVTENSLNIGKPKTKNSLKYWIVPVPVTENSLNLGDRSFLKFVIKHVTGMWF